MTLGLDAGTTCCGSGEMAKPEPNLVEVNRLMSGEPGAASQTVDVEYALAALRAENARLRDCANCGFGYQGCGLHLAGSAIGQVCRSHGSPVPRFLRSIEAVHAPHAALISDRWCELIPRIADRTSQRPPGGESKTK